jgi:hypothetical protein
LSRVNISRIGLSCECQLSSAELQPPHSLTAASERKAATQTRNFDFPELTSAYERGADAELRFIEYFQQAASGAKGGIHQTRKTPLKAGLHE